MKTCPKVPSSKIPGLEQKKRHGIGPKFGLILLPDQHGYPPVERDKICEEIFEQVENFKKNRVV